MYEIKIHLPENEKQETEKLKTIISDGIREKTLAKINEKNFNEKLSQTLKAFFYAFKKLCERYFNIQKDDLLKEKFSKDEIIELMNLVFERAKKERNRHYLWLYSNPIGWIFALIEKSDLKNERLFADCHYYWDACKYIKCYQYLFKNNNIAKEKLVKAVRDY